MSDLVFIEDPAYPLHPVQILGCQVDCQKLVKPGCRWPRVKPGELDQTNGDISTIVHWLNTQCPSGYIMRNTWYHSYIWGVTTIGWFYTTVWWCNTHMIWWDGMKYSNTSFTSVFTTKVVTDSSQWHLVSDPFFDRVYSWLEAGWWQSTTDIPQKCKDARLWGWYLCDGPGIFSREWKMTEESHGTEILGKPNGYKGKGNFRNCRIDNDVLGHCIFWQCGGEWNTVI